MKKRPWDTDSSESYTIERPTVCPNCKAEIEDHDASHCTECGKPLPIVRKSIDDKIIAFLRRELPHITEVSDKDFRPWEMPLGRIAEGIGMSEKKSSVSYHLTALEKAGIVSKVKADGKNPGYRLVNKEGGDLLESKVIVYLESDNYSPKSSGAILAEMTIMQDEYVTPAEAEKAGFDSTVIIDEVNAVLYKLEKTGEIECSHNVDVMQEDGTTMQEDHWEIPFWRLPDYICHHCRKVIEDGELRASYITRDSNGTYDNHPIHATCKPQMLRPDAAYSEGDPGKLCCDYCGLNLRASEIDFVAGSANNKMVESAMEKLFDTPYAVLFSYIDARNDAVDFYSQEGVYSDGRETFGQDLESRGYAHYVEKDGKKYHPYCARQVEQLQVEKEMSSVQ